MASLKALIVGKKMKWQLKTELFNIPLDPCVLDSPMNDALFRLKSRVITIVVNSRQVKPLMWESLLVEEK